MQPAPASHLFQPNPVRPSPSRISVVSGLAVRSAPFSSRLCLPCRQSRYRQQGRFLHRRYPASQVLPAPPPPSRLSADFPGLPVIRPTFAPPISQRGEEGFSSCLARPRHRTVATTPPECRSASASLRYAMLLCPRLEDSASGLLSFEATRAFTLVTVRQLADHPLRWSCQWVGSRTAPPVGSVNPAPLVTFPAPLVKRSMRISRTTLSCLLRVKVMWPFASGALSEQPIAAASYSTSSNRAPSVSAGFSLLLHVYPLSQVPQFHRRLYHLASASLVAKVITDSGAASLHRRYPASLVLPTPPPPLACQPTPGAPGYTAYLCSPISRRGEEGFSSCLARPRHRAVATTPPSAVAPQPVCAASYCFRPLKADSAFRALMSRGHLCVHSRYGPVTRQPPLR